MRNPNGMGTIYKLKGNRRKPWIARKPDGWIDDRIKYRTVGYFETKTAAREALVLDSIQPVATNSNITLAKLYEEFKAIKYQDISISLQNNYIAAYKHCQRYSNQIFKNLRTAHWQNIINDKKESLSGSSLLKIKGLAGLLYKYAMQNDIVNKNYSEFIKLPKETRAEKEIFTDMEIKALEQDESIWAGVVLILIYTGLRITELLTLTRFNIDLEKQIIIAGIKTDAGRGRIIPIQAKILKHIKYWYDLNGEALICKDGRKMTTKYYRENYYYPVLDDHKISKTKTPHVCRHTCASLLARAGASTVSIQKIMGHTDYSMTANIYTHPNIEELKKAMNLL